LSGTLERAPVPGDELHRGARQDRRNRRPGQSRAPASPWPGGLRILHEARDVAVRVLDRGHQLAAADVAWPLLDGRAGSDELLDRLVDVVNKPVWKRRGHPLSVAVGVESDVLATSVPADVLRLVVSSRGSQQA